MNLRKLNAALIASACMAATASFAAAGSQIPDPVTAADPKEQRADVEGAFKLPAPGTGSTAEVAPPVEEIVVAEEVVVVAPVGTDTACGLVVLSKSEAAVGDPCKTTADVMADLGLSAQQIAYVNAHSDLDQAIAH